MDENTSVPTGNHITLAADVVSAYLANNHVQPADLRTLIASVHAAITGLGDNRKASEPETDKPTPAQIRKSIRPDALISFIDGKPYKALKRHLTGHGLTIQQYRERYGLPRDYPTTAASYSEQRSALAKSAGLGQQRRNAAPKAAEVAETITEALKARGRKKAAEAPAKPTRARRPKAAAA